MDSTLAKSLEQSLAMFGLESEVKVGSAVEALRHRQWLAIVSSHLGKSARLHMEVCRYLSRSMMDARQDGRVVLIAKGSAIEPWATRAAELFGVPMISVEIDPSDPRKGDCAASAIRVASRNSIDRDGIVVLLADRVDCVYARGGGNIDRALRCRLSGDHAPNVRIAIHASGNPKASLAAASSLMDRGAVGWYCRPVQRGPRQTNSDVVEVDRLTPSTVDWTRSDGQWLVHCTRSYSGPWPGQSQRQYLDELLLGQSTSIGTMQRTVMDSLERILRSDRLVASALASCRQTPVVCFSEAPLATLLSRRSYRSHLHRWDYEPYGIAIRKSAAIAAGFQRVIYGEPDDRKRLAPQDRFRFQARGRTHDWTQEREWRSSQDVVLKDFASNDICLFVADPSEAERVQGRFQVFVVGHLLETPV